MAEKAVDSRVRRTKRLLKQGLTELMAQKSIKKIKKHEQIDARKNRQTKKKVKRKKKRSFLNIIFFKQLLFWRNFTS